MNRYGKDGVPFLFIIDYNCSNPIVLPIKNVDPTIILYSIDGKTNVPPQKRLKRSFSFNTFPIPYAQYKCAFEFVVQQQIDGDSYLANLTFPTRLETDLSLNEIFHHSFAKYKLLYHDSFVLFSPETFVRIHDNAIFSFPMKGTIDANISNAEQILLADEKESAEHITIVDLIRNDLGMIAQNITVNKFRYIEKIRTPQKDLLQTSSEITGTLPFDYREKIGTILFTLLPAGSVTGAPKQKTVEIINTAETYQRGYYTGVFGYFDGNTLDSAVMIRFIENIDGELYYKSGGGITVYSDPETEYRELIDKVYVPII